MKSLGFVGFRVRVKILGLRFGAWGLGLRVWGLSYRL